VPSVFGTVLTVLAVLCAVAAVSLVFQQRMQPVRDTIDALLVPAPANLGYAAFIGVLAAGVTHRKRVAYWMLVIYFALQLLSDALASGVFYLVQTLPVSFWDGDVPQIDPWLAGANLVLTLGVLVVLALSADEFYAKVQRASVGKALLTLFGLLAMFSVLGWLLVEAFPGTVRPGVARFTYAAERLIAGGVFDIHRVGLAPGWVNLVIGLFGAISLFAALYALFRSQRAIAALSPGEERRLRALLAASGERDSLGYFATRRDKAVIFSPTGKAAVTYRVVTGVCLASGDPIGDPEAWGPAIEAWLELTRQYAWTPAVMGAGEEGATAYARAGLRVIELGDEAIIHVRDFGLDGREMRPVRQAVGRVQRAGYKVRIRRHAEIPPEEMARIIDLAARWRDTETERGFSMALGRLGDPADGQCVLVEALDGDGRESALLSFAPWGRRGLSLELMRRDRASDNGLVEFMVAEIMSEAPRLGVDRVSMNFAVFRSVFEEGGRIGAGPVLRAWRRLLLFFSRWFQLESLYRSNMKYRPEWVPRYLCFDDLRELAKVGLASAIAEGFVVVPSLRTLLRRGAAAPSVLPAGEVEEEQAPPAEAVPAAPAVPEQTRIRLEKLRALRDAGVDPYPPGFARTHACGQVRQAHAGLAPDTETGERVAVAGRVVMLRDHGKLWFLTLRDWSGDLQVMLPAEVQGGWKSTVDLGDHVGVHGEVITTRRGQVSVRAEEWTLTAKCLHPLPDKPSGLDLIDNLSAREVLRARGTAVQAVRAVLAARDFLEIEPPLPDLTRLAVAGVERAFELRRDAERGTLAAYQAYAASADMRELAADLLPAAGHELPGDWPVVGVYTAVSAALGAEVSADTGSEPLRSLAATARVPVRPEWGAGEIVRELYERLVVVRAEAPTIHVDFPVEAFPLVRAQSGDPRLAERWALVASGTELAAGYTVLVDPLERRRRLAAGGEVAELDEGILSALEYAMPPTGGLELTVFPRIYPNVLEK
jgi:lysyl-tRNA synthetase class 2